MENIEYKKMISNQLQLEEGLKSLVKDLLLELYRNDQGKYPNLILKQFDSQYEACESYGLVPSLGSLKESYENVKGVEVK